MAKIQPITSWQDGVEKEGVNFNLIVVNDNLSTQATFWYTISTEEINHTETIIVTPEIPAWDEPLPDGGFLHHDAIPAVTKEITVVDVPSVILVSGNINISGQDYQDWDADPSANSWAYNWAAIQLKLTLIPDQFIA